MHLMRNVCKINMLYTDNLPQTDYAALRPGSNYGLVP